MKTPIQPMQSTASLFDQMVRTNHKVYRSPNPLIKAELKDRKAAAKKANAGLPMHTNEIYKCNTCGTKGKSHPTTSYCFVCDTDNWELIQGQGKGSISWIVGG